MAGPRVLLATSDFPPSTGGIAVLMDRLVRHMSGLSIRVLTFSQPGADELDSDGGLDVSRVADLSMDRRAAVVMLNARLVWEALRFRPDVIVSGHIVTSMAAILAKRLLRIPLVQYVYAEEFRGRGRLTRLAVQRADVVIAISRFTRDLAVAAGADPEKVRIIPPGVDLPPRQEVSRETKPTLLTVASLIFRRKGHDVIIRALPRIRESIPDARWVVIGDGPLRPEIEREAHEAGLDGCVTFLGRVEDEERDRWLGRAHAFCMPSRIPEAGAGGEGFGIVYLEAGAHHLPVIGGNVGGALDAVIDGDTGLLVDPTDHEAVAAAAIELLSDPALARRMGDAGRRHAEAHAWPRIAERVEEVIRDVAADSG